MGIIVQKYGGSSLRDVERLKAVAQRIADTCAQGHRVVAVVSAMGKSTDGLIELARQVSPNPGRRELDMLVSVGERISMTLLSMAVNALGLEAISFTGSQSGIITDTSHFNARILEVRPDRLRRALEAGKVVIVAGYQGVSLDKEVTTLGRGGTDTSAVALAAALGAEYCEICSDIDGVYSADPRVVGGAHHIESLSHDEMLALSQAGAKVLAAEAVAYAKAHGIEIHAASTFEPGRHTRIVVEQAPRGPVAVTGDTRLAHLRWRGPSEEVPELLAFLSREAIEPIGLRVIGVAGEDGLRQQDLSLRFRTINVPDLSRVMTDGQARFGGAFVLADDGATVTLIGQGVGSRRDGSATDVLGMALRELGGAGVSVREVEIAGASVTLSLDREQVEDAQRTLHRLFLDEA